MCGQSVNRHRREAEDGTYEQTAAVDDFAVDGALCGESFGSRELIKRSTALGIQRNGQGGIVRVAKDALHCAGDALSEELEMDNETEEVGDLLADKGRFENVADGVDKDRQRRTSSGRYNG